MPDVPSSAAPVRQERRRVVVIGSCSLSVALLILSAVALLNRAGLFLLAWRSEALGPLQAEIGLAYTARTGHPELSAHERLSLAQVTEDGRPLPGPANSPHDDIRTAGRGRFSFWHDALYLATSDNSDPRSNGRTYGIRYPLRLGGLGTAVLCLISLLVSGLSVRSLWRSRQRREGPSRGQGATLVAVRRALAAGFRPFAGFLLVVSAIAVANEAGVVSLLWRTETLTGIQAQAGFAYTARTHHPELSAHDRPSPAQVLEDGKLLAGPPNSSHDDIRAIGRGRYSFWRDSLYLSSSDNSDPRSNGRTYLIRYPARLGAVATSGLCLVSLLAAGSFVRPLSRKRERTKSASSDGLGETPTFWLVVFAAECFLLGLALTVNGLVAVSIDAHSRLRATPSETSFPSLAPGAALLLAAFALAAVPGVRTRLRRSRVFAYVVPMHIWVLLALAGMESILRVTVYSEPFVAVRTNWFGTVFPGGSFYLWAKEGFAVTRFDGLPWEIQTPFRGGESIFVLGDSFTESLQVPDRQKYPSVAETILRRDGYPMDIRNLGHSGMAMADYVTNVERYRALVQPRMIVVQLGDSDFVESFDAVRFNYFVARDGKIVDLVHKAPMEGAYQESELLSVNLGLMLWGQYGKSRAEQMWASAPPRSTGVAPLPAVAATAPPTFEPDLATQQMELLLAAARGARLVLILSPHAPFVSGDRIEMEDKGHEALRAFLARSYPQLTVVDPLPEFRRLAMKWALPMGFFNSPTPGWGHLNRRGHEVIGRLLARAIEGGLE